MAGSSLIGRRSPGRPGLFRLEDGVGVNSPEFVRRVVAANNQRIAQAVPGPVSGVPQRFSSGVDGLRRNFPAIRAEWECFVAGGGRLPMTEDLFQAWQGNVDSWWRSGLLLLRGRRCDPLAQAFPSTVASLQAIPGVLSAMWSVLGPGATIPEHRGDNAGGLRMLLGVDCPVGSGHSVNGSTVSIPEGDVVIFDDTFPHAAWNRSDRPRVLILADLVRPLPLVTGVRNVSTQWVRHQFTGRYRNAATIAAEWHVALNGEAPPRSE